MLTVACSVPALPVHTLISSANCEPAAHLHLLAGEATAQPQHMAEFSLRILRHILQQRAQPGWNAVVWRALRSACACSGALSGRPGLWREALKLLHMASLPSQQDFLPVACAGMPLKERVSFWAELATNSALLPVRKFALDWLQEAALAGAASCSQLPEQAPGPVEGTLDVEALLAAFKDLDLDEQLLESDSAAPGSMHARQAAACLFNAVVDALLPLAANSTAEVRSTVARSFQMLLPALSSLPESAEQPVKSAQQDAPAAEPGKGARTGIVLSGEQLALLGQAASERLSDADGSVAAAWSGVVPELAPHLARLATGIGTGAAAPSTHVTVHVRAPLK